MYPEPGTKIFGADPTGCVDGPAGCTRATGRFVAADEVNPSIGCSVGNVFKEHLTCPIVARKVGSGKIDDRVRRAATFFLSLGSIFFRYALMALPIIVAIKFEQFNLVAAIVGLFMIQFVILADHLVKLISPIRNK